MKFKPLFITLVILISLALTSNLTAQNLSGRENSQPMGKSVSVSKLNQGNYSGEVSPFSGNLQSSYFLGEVSTPLGVSFNVNLSYSSTFNCSENQQVISGIPYGEGWDIDIPKISISTEAVNKIRTYIDKKLGHGIVSIDDMIEHGSLYWFAPVISIPGVINERFVFKHKTVDGDLIFVPCVFEKYVEAIFNGQIWKVKLSDGTIYEFNLSITAMSNASNININPKIDLSETEINQDYTEYKKSIEDYNAFRTQQISENPEMENVLTTPVSEPMSLSEFRDIYLNGRNDKSKQALLNIIMPKPQILSWFCNSIYNPTHPSNQKISFVYETGGLFNYFKEYSYDYQNIMAIAVINRLMTSSSIVCNPLNPNNCTEVLNRLPDYYISKHVVLKSVIASVENTIIDYINLDYETLESNNFVNVPKVTPNKVFPKKYMYQQVEHLDNFYNWSNAYSVGVNSIEEKQEIFGNELVDDPITQKLNFQNWYRYHHIMSDYSKANLGLASGALFDPWAPEARKSVNRYNPYQFYSGDWKYFRTKQSDYDVYGLSESMRFDDSYLESNSIPYGQNSNQNETYIIPGDIYEIRAMISNPEMCNYDFNIVSGKANQSVHDDENRIVNSNLLSKFQSDVIFSTFNQAIKWNSRGTSRNRLVTSNLFTFPNLPKEYGGVNIQVGPANSNHQFNFLHDLQRTGYKASDCYAWMSQDNPDKIGPTNNIPHNFGIGMPWYMVKELNDYIHDPENLTDNYADFWFNDIDKSDQNSGLINKPTLSGKESYLHSLALIRYSQNPYMLKSVSHYKLNGEDKGENGGINGDFVIVERYDLKYSVINDNFSNPGISRDNNGVVDLKTTSITRNIVLLNQVITMPITTASGSPINYSSLNIATYNVYVEQGLKTTFEYSPGMEYKKKYLGGIGITKELVYNTHPLIKITNHLGGITEIKYYPCSTSSSNNSPIILENVNYVGYYAPLPSVLDIGEIKKAADIVVSVQLVVNSITKKGRNNSDDKTTSYTYGPVIEKSIIPKGSSIKSASIKERSFKGFAFTTIYNEIGNGVFKTEKIEFYSDDIKFGRVQKITEKEDGKTVKTSESIYSPIKISNRVNVNWGGFLNTSVLAISGSVVNNSELSIKTFTRSDNYKLDIPMAENFQIPMTFYESYFVRKVKSITKNYDQTDASNQRYISHVTEYSYWDADFNKKSSTIGYNYLSKYINKESPQGKVILEFEPSYQLYSEKKYSEEQPIAYTLDEYFYYYDLPVANNATSDQSILYPYNSRVGWRGVAFNILKHGVRDKIYEKRSTFKGSDDKEAIANSIYYIYKANWGNNYFYTINDVILTSNCPTSPSGTVIGKQGSGNHLFPSDQYWIEAPLNSNYVNKPLLFGYNTLGVSNKGSFQEINNLSPIYTPPAEPIHDLGTLSQNIGINNDLIALEKVVVQMDRQINSLYPVTDRKEAILRFSHDIVYPFTTNLTKKEITERNSVGLVKKEKDEKGMFTEYTFNDAKRIYYRCNNTQNSNNGLFIGGSTFWNLPLLPKKISSGGLEINYDYTSSLQLYKVTDPNGKVSLSSFDNFGRLIKSQVGDGITNYTTNLYNYHNWSGQAAESFYQRAASNYVETITYNAFANPQNGNFNKVRSYIDPMGRDFQTILENYYSGEHLKTGEVEYDELNHPIKKYKNFLSLTTTPEYREIADRKTERVVHNIYSTEQLNFPFQMDDYTPEASKYEMNSNGRVLASSKAGRQIDPSDKYVSSEYSIITLSQLNAELSTNYTSNAGITNPFTAIMAVPNSTLTSYLQINMPEYIARKNLQGNQEASSSQKVRDDYINISITNADKNRYYKTKIIDEDGNETRLYYTPDGNKIAERKSLTNDLNAVTLFTYDCRGNLVKIVNPEKQTSRFKYNFANFQYQKETPDGNVVTRIFNSRGLIVLEQDQNGRKGADHMSKYVRQYDYDNFDRLIEQKKVSYRFENYNPMSELYIEPTDPDAETGRVWDNIIDIKQSITEIKSMFSSVNLDVKVLTDFLAVDFPADNIPATTSLIQPPVSLRWYDNNVSMTTIPRIDVSFFDPQDPPIYGGGYSEPSTPTEIAEGFDNTASIVWDNNNYYPYLKSQTLEKKWNYDNQGMDPSGYKINSSTNDPNASIRIIPEYSIGKLTRTISFDNKGKEIEHIIYSYDLFGNLISEDHQFNKDEIGNSKIDHYAIHYQYDLQGRVIGKTVLSDSYSSNFGYYSFDEVMYYQFEYDNFGRLLHSKIDGHNVVSYYYNPINGKILEKKYYALTKVNPLQQINFEYDLRDRLNKIFVQDQLFREDIYYDNQLTGSSMFSGINQEKYNGNISGVKINYKLSPPLNTNTYWIDNPMYYKYTYDKNDRLVKADAHYSAITNSNGAIVEEYGDEGYTYDKIGNMLTQHYAELVANSGAYYVQHVMNYKYTPGTSKAYLIDDVSTLGTFVRNYQIDKTGQTRTDERKGINKHIEYGRSGMPFSYNRNDNTKDVFLYGINDNRIYQSFNNEQDEYLLIDAQGQILASRKNLSDPQCQPENFVWYIYGHEREAEYKSSNSSNTKLRYYIKDHIGNTRLSYNIEVNNSTTPHDVIFSLSNITCYDYSPYGKVIQAIESTGFSKFLTTDNERDMKTGYDYRHMRFSDPETGRFLSVDPMAGQAPGWTPYRYCFDNPINLTDPSGLWEGDYYKNGNWIASDKINDGRVYFNDVNGNIKFGKDNYTEWSYTIQNVNFSEYFPTLMKYEGGFVNNIKDPGGATNKGITLAEFQKHSKNLLNLDPTLDNLKHLSNSQAAKIYEIAFWNPSQAGRISDKQISWLHFDTYVNGGAKNVLSQTTKQFGLSGIDGLNKAISDHGGENVFNSYKSERINRYDRLIHNNPNLETFRNGWMNRMDDFNYSK